MPSASEAQLEALLSAYEATLAASAWHWPANTATGRAYLCGASPGGDPRCFVKLATSGDALRLDRDVTLSRLAGERLAGTRFRVPRTADAVTPLGGDGATVALTYEPLPRDAQAAPGDAAFPAAASQAYQGTPREVPRHDVDTLSWWDPLARLCRDARSTFADVLLAHLPDTLHVGLVHGDMSPTNLAHGGGAVWLLDWEKASEDGPVHVDAWSFGHGNRAGAEIARREWEADPVAALLGIGYQAARGHDGWRALVIDWNQIGREVMA